MDDKSISRKAGRKVQKSLDIIHDYAASIGLACSAEESEYVVIIYDIARRALEYRDMVILKKGKPVRQRDFIRILGFFWQKSGKFNVIINRLTRNRDNPRHDTQIYETEKSLERTLTAYGYQSTNLL